MSLWGAVFGDRLPWSTVEQTSKLRSELRPREDVDDHVVGVDEQVEAVENREGVLHDHVPMSYGVVKQQSIARPADVWSERHKVQQVVDELPVGQGEDDVEEGRREEHQGRCGGRVRRTGRLLMLLLLLLLLLMMMMMMMITAVINRRSNK